MTLRLAPSEAFEVGCDALVPRSLPFPVRAVHEMREASTRARRERVGRGDDSIARAERALAKVELNFQRLVKQMQAPIAEAKVSDGPRPPEGPSHAA